MRTQEEIIKRIEEVKDDFLGVEFSDLISYLNYENAKQYLKPEVTKEMWKEKTDETVKKEMQSYIDFAFEKCFDERGISSSRNLMHYSAWIWLLNDGKFSEFEEKCENEYAMYGKLVLIWITKTYNLNLSKENEGQLK